MVASDIPHEQATELVKGRETIIDQCRRCRQGWPCEVKVLQAELDATRPVYRAAMSAVAAPGTKVEIAGVVIQACDAYGRPLASPHASAVADAVGDTDECPVCGPECSMDHAF